MGRSWCFSKADIETLPKPLFFAAQLTIFSISILLFLRPWMRIICSPLPQNNGNLPLPFFDGNYPIISWIIFINDCICILTSYR